MQAARHQHAATPAHTLTVVGLRLLPALRMGLLAGSACCQGLRMRWSSAARSRRLRSSASLAWGCGVGKQCSPVSSTRGTRGLRSACVCGHVSVRACTHACVQAQAPHLGLLSLLLGPLPLFKPPVREAGGGGSCPQLRACPAQTYTHPCVPCEWAAHRAHCTYACTEHAQSTHAPAPALCLLLEQQVPLSWRGHCRSKADQGATPVPPLRA